MARAASGAAALLLWHAEVVLVVVADTTSPGPLALQQECEKVARDPSCFQGPFFKCSECCDTRLTGRGGNAKCWGQGYTYERCCPVCPQAHDPTCFPADSSWTCEACCDPALGRSGNAACWGAEGRSFERCCLGRAPICTPQTDSASPSSRRAASGPALQTSQYGQDRFMLKWLDCPQHGFYLDLGAYDGEHLSNTHSLDVDLGWRGVCVDAVLRPSHFASRSCRLVQRALHSETGREMRFQRFPEHHESAYGGLMQGEELAAAAGSGGADGGGSDDVLGQWEALSVVTLSVRDLLRGLEAEGFRVPRVIDYVSVDVEGAVPSVLEGFPFDRYCVRVWTLEVWTPEYKQGGREDLLRVAALMQDNGYLLVQVLGPDHVFVHRRDCAPE